jgi:hypothetical protein
MKRWFAPLLVGLALIFYGFSVKEIPGTKPFHLHLPQPVQPAEPEIKAATPEEPGPIATIVGPLAVWEQVANPTLAEPARRPNPSPVDHLVYFEAGKPSHLLHHVFSINNCAQFVFSVPPHQGNGRLHGTFRSFTMRNDPDSSNHAADLDLILLNEQEFNEFLQGQPQSVTYELNSAHNQMVDWHVPATYKDPQTYHLVFSNSGRTTKTLFVQADFTVSFE